MTRRDIFKLFAGSATIPAVKSVEVLDVKKDDIVVLSFAHRLSEKSMLNISNMWRKQFPHIQCIVLDDAASASVIRKERV